MCECSKPINPSPNHMIVIIRHGAWELISAPQSVAEAWALADRLTSETGITHWVGRA